MSLSARPPKILVIGTGDTKSEELLFMAEVIGKAGGVPVMVDVSVLGEPPYAPEHSKHDIAKAAGTSIQNIVDSGDENTAMALMAKGAAELVRGLSDAGAVDGMIALGGSLGTDLALDVAAVLPLGVPKFIVSTIAYSHLLPPERIAPDLMMILWAGGLYGLNPICRAVLSQACGAVVGAAKAAERPDRVRPLIGMTSLGSSCLKYMKYLKPELEKRGYDVAVFHATGMGGRAYEAVAADRGFAAVFDFCIQEVTNAENGSVVTSGPDRLENAGRAGIPQIVAPGAVDMVDMPAWQDTPARFAGRPYHAHNRLIASVTVSPEQRREVARVVAAKMAGASAPVAFLLPSQGIQEWDQEGEPLHEPAALAAFLDEMRKVVTAAVAFEEVDTHINAPAFAAKALEVFDRWVAEGIVEKGRIA
ncbi:Tm-1-like ATP-binding domain-containing protein [Shinella sp. CPCC 101442]|uniref:Tm-1-like ATP-binding domain-containing protein n=1 Tax=Shinella sp. CPCC 101442 TaxID=2932265 RepID=UPI002152FC42|nr:Tm-1-like ATP-binding domain-containing protein [Shinella sp. CPCC 101442]MCR6497681.1 Tm-1-like ATP-binding domain-containing protein [Shinella sp. CPCC 101442]